MREGRNLEVHELVVTGVELLQVSAAFRALERQQHVLRNTVTRTWSPLAATGSAASKQTEARTFDTLRTCSWGGSASRKVNLLREMLRTTMRSNLQGGGRSHTSTTCRRAPVSIT
jgi:hypothetical protein